MVTMQIGGRGSWRGEKKHVIFYWIRDTIFNIHGICWHQKHKTETTELLPQYVKNRINGKTSLISKYILIHSFFIYCAHLPGASKLSQISLLDYAFLNVF